MKQACRVWLINYGLRLSILATLFPICNAGFDFIAAFCLNYRLCNRHGFQISTFCEHQTNAFLFHTRQRLLENFNKAKLIKIVDFSNAFGMISWYLLVIKVLNTQTHDSAKQLRAVAIYCTQRKIMYNKSFKTRRSTNIVTQESIIFPLLFSLLT